MNAAANDDFFVASSEPSFSGSESAKYNDRLADKISLLAGQINAANYRFLKMIAEFDRLKAWAGYGFRSCAHWLDWKCGIAIGAARERVRVARALDDLPEINAAFEKGELSYSKVREITRIATKQNQEYLLMIAQYGTAQQLTKLASTFRTVSRYQDFEPEGPLRERLEEEFKTEQSEQIIQEEERFLNRYQDDEGMWVIHARLPAEVGGLLVKLMDSLGDQIALNHKDRAVDLSSGDVPAGTSEPDIAACDTAFGTVSNIEPLTFPQRRADALVAIAEQFLAADRTEPIGSLRGSERCQLMLHVHSGSGASRDANLDGRWISHEAAKCLACDASLVVVEEEDEEGNVLNIGRRSRVIPVGMSRALSIRDNGRCQFPGCCESRFVEGHHIQHWAEGGETRLDNLVTLCRYHHRELHRGHVFLSLKPEALGDQLSERFSHRLVFSRGDHGFKEGVAVIEASPCCAVHSQNELPWSIRKDVTVQAAVTRWQGERMDLGMAVEGLLARGCTSAWQDVSA